ncbi:hypothetical protein C0585_02405 [Candidatus Woesearchaeota archaeon]|nr:MAG: hypothetical protein C0585_02405 [Candidatus Woesearchaeota archaeon]
MDFIIRKLKDSDIIKAGNVVKKAQRLTLKDYYSKELIDAFCNKNNPKNFAIRAKERQFYIAEIPKRKKIIGVIAKKDNELKTFFVHPNYQGKGVGRKLFEKVRDETLKQGYDKLIVKSSHYAVNIYKKLGFKFIKKIKQEVDGLPFIDNYMEQELK